MSNSKNSNEIIIASNFIVDEESKLNNIKESPVEDSDSSNFHQIEYKKMDSHVVSL